MHKEFRERLDELKRLDTVSPFSQLFYELIARRLETDGADAEPLRRAFAALVERELRHHLRLRNLSAPHGVDEGEAASVADKRRVSFQDTMDILDGAPAANDDQEATRRLMLAECSYHLGQHDRVVADIEAAIDLGADDPIVHMALGCNRYMLAVEAFTVEGEEAGTRSALDPPRYRAAMLDAVAAFESALSGGPLDPEVYWWIGACLEQAGFDDASRDAYRRAGLRGEDGGERDQDGVDGEREGRDPPEITPEEVRQAGEVLKRSFTIAQVLGESESERP